MDKSQPWGPYSRDCTRGYCSYYCPQWCFFLLPPPLPPPPSPSRPLLSPLLIAVVAVIATAFLLVTCYLILTRYRRRRVPTSPPDNPLAAWHAARPDGLDETLINRIAACQYWSDSGLIVDGTDCSVCLSQFEDGDRVRRLPRCGHAFHVDCIDAWLKAHSSCPLCRAGIFPLPTTSHCNGTICTVNADQQSESVSSEESDLESESDNTTGENVGSGRPRDVVSHDVIEIRECRGVIGRSLSADSSLRRQAEGAGPSRWSRALQSVPISPIQMKRSRSLTSALPT